MNVVLKPAKHLRGEVRLPGDKSITHRAMMIGAISEGTTEVVGFSNAADPLSTLNCIRALGVEMEISGQTLFIKGRGLRKLSRPGEILYAGNSGTTIRLLSGILAAQEFDSVITGDSSLRTRPMKRVIDPLVQMGARIEAGKDHTPPIKIYPTSSLLGIEYELPVPSAQVKSAIILAALHADGITHIQEPLRTRDHTERMLGLEVQGEDGKKTIIVEGQKSLPGRKFTVPGDISAATYFIIASCLVPNSELHLSGVGLNPTRTAILDLLKKMGADIEIEKEGGADPEPRGNITVRTSTLQNAQIAPALIPSILDEIPTLAVAAAKAKGRFEIRGASELRVKESDRIKTLCGNLKKLGVEVEEFEDGFAFDGENQLIPSEPLNSFSDHRIAMAMGVAGLVAERSVEVVGAECVDISFPGYWNLLSRLST